VLFWQFKLPFFLFTAEDAEDAEQKRKKIDMKKVIYSEIPSQLANLSLLFPSFLFLRAPALTRGFA
jgi:hypothetical protein